MTETIQPTSKETLPEVPTVEKKPKEGEEIVTPVVPPEEITADTEMPSEIVVPPVTPVVPVVAPKTPVTPPVDYKKKFGESTRRNQIVESQFKELQKTLGDITRQEVPTDEEMSASISDWEYLSDREKNAERKLVVLERRTNHVISTIGNIASETENASKLEQFVESEPRLEGKEEAFYDFVSKPANKGASMEVLLNAFLFEVKDESVVVPPVTPPTEEIPPSLERGNSSGNMPLTPTGKKEYSDEELQVLRTKDPRKYHELIRKGVI